jgi:hypothetical protein
MDDRIQRRHSGIRRLHGCVVADIHGDGGAAGRCEIGQEIELPVGGDDLITFGQEPSRQNLADAAARARDQHRSCHAALPETCDSYARYWYAC